MIVDSTALPEQVTRDVLRSAFDSAGQRCSAARVLMVQDDVADKMLEMITGAAACLAIGDPIDYATDVGPVIEGLLEDRRREDVVDDDGRAHGMGNLGDGGQVYDLQRRVRHGFKEHRLGVGAHRRTPLVEIGTVHQCDFDAKARQDVDVSETLPLIEEVRLADAPK